jgi:hypothetical protein
MIYNDWLELLNLQGFPVRQGYRESLCAPASDSVHKSVRKEGGNENRDLNSLSYHRYDPYARVETMIESKRSTDIIQIHPCPSPIPGRALRNETHLHFTSITLILPRVMMVMIRSCSGTLGSPRTGTASARRRRSG